LPGYVEKIRHIDYCQFPIADCRFEECPNWQSQIENWQ
jgi:hypothetical protein